jgi:outer membrane protein
MGVSPRKLSAIGLSLAGFIYMVAPSQGQAPKADPRVQGTANTTTAGARPAGSLTPATPTVVGTVDLDYVFKNYEKVKKGELMKYDQEAQQVVEMMKKLNPTSEDYHKQENKLTELKAKMEASKEQAEREITLRQAETMATLYKEVQAYAKWVAQRRGITHVMTSTNTPPTGSDPNTVLAAVNRPVIFSDPANDITNDVVYYLNQSYQKLGKPADKPAAVRQPAAGAAAVGDQ